MQPDEELNPYTSPSASIDYQPDVELPYVETGFNRRQFAAYFFGAMTIIGCILWLLESSFPAVGVHFIVPLTLSVIGNTALFWIFAMRYQNIGWNKWLGLQFLIPLVNLVAIIQCLTLQPGYARADRIDETGKTVAMSLAFCFVLVVAVVLILIV